MTTKILRTVEALEDYMKCLRGFTVFDTETKGLSIGVDITMCSFYDFKTDPVSIPFKTVFSEGITQREFATVWNKYVDNIQVIGHNIKYDIGVLRTHGAKLPTIVADTSSMIHLYNPDLLKKLETRVKADLKYDKKTYEEIIGMKWEKVDWDREIAKGIITIENLGEYAAEDVYWTGMLYNHYAALMRPEDWKLLDEIEIPLIFTLADMYHFGQNINVNLLNKIDKQLEEGLIELTNKIHESAGAVFNIRSGPQKASILFDKLGLPCRKATKGGGRSTDSDVLEDLAEEGYEICQLLVEYSKMEKLKSGYTVSIPNLLDADGRLRCSFNQNDTRTGRFSSSKPNLQNQPNNSQYPIRKAFIPTEGWILCGADLSQIELRIMAHVSGDVNFSRAFFEDRDIHGAVAADLGITRKGAKVINFGVLYGMGIEKLARTLGIHPKEAERIIYNYEKTYRGYARWKKATEEYAARNGYIENIFGRIRRLPDAKRPSDKRAYYKALRQAVNTVVQGSAADMIKISMNNIQAEFLKRDMRSRMTLTVHDELLVDTHPNEVEDAFSIMVDKMENSVKLSVPLKTDGKVIDTWDRMKQDDFKTLMYKYSRPKLPYYLL